MKKNVGELREVIEDMVRSEDDFINLVKFNFKPSLKRVPDILDKYFTHSTRNAYIYPEDMLKWGWILPQNIIEVY